ncbi:MAG: ATP synthase F1 subunit epsilon [Opitutales bacterium]|nr:ATP synthase F1 subunit epsilon [Opitutales bacterium]NRA26081.1 ATP synthase F1 subunit epsilon [Opitutales bacterium]
MSLTLRIVTPEKVAFDQTIEQVVLPTAQGQMGILSGHIPLLTEIEGGALHVTHDDGKQEHLAIDKGFAEVHSDTVAILTEAAIDVEEIDLTAVAEAKKRAQEAIENADENIDPAELERLESVARFAVFQELAKSGS